MWDDPSLESVAGVMTGSSGEGLALPFEFDVFAEEVATI
jgi:hypothetical protein